MSKIFNTIGYSLLNLTFILLVGFVIFNSEKIQPKIKNIVSHPNLSDDFQAVQLITERGLNHQNIPDPGFIIRSNHGLSGVTDPYDTISLTKLVDNEFELTPSLAGPKCSPPRPQ